VAVIKGAEAGREEEEEGKRKRGMLCRWETCDSWEGGGARRWREGRDACSSGDV
jgi:hypothetical protein